MSDGVIGEQESNDISWQLLSNLYRLIPVYAGWQETTEKLGVTTPGLDMVSFTQDHKDVSYYLCLSYVTLFDIPPPWPIANVEIDMQPCCHPTLNRSDPYIWQCIVTEQTQHGYKTK